MDHFPRRRPDTATLRAKQDPPVATPMSRHLRSSVLCLLLAALGLSLVAITLTACARSGGASPSPSSASDSVVVTVNGRPVRRSAVDAVRAELRLGGTSNTEAKAVKEAIARELVRQEAERLGVVADPAKVRARRKTMAAQVGGEAGLVAALKRVPMTEVQLQRDLEDGVLREALQDAKYPGRTATRKAARAYYERHLRQSFVRPASIRLGAIRVPAEPIAESALARLRSGRPFHEVARQFTTDLEAKANGGDLGWVLASSLPTPLRKVAAAMKTGDVSKPFAGPGGWYVLKVLGKHPARVTPFAAVERRLIEELTLLERSKALDAWLVSARSKATVAGP
jgi:parvulin-like peptidyl-prolyl isomerase